MQVLQTVKNWPLLWRIFSKIPGPLLAKLTRLWKTYHLLRGTYRNKLKELHALHGPLIQVAPREFSWEYSVHDKQQLRSLEKFAPRGANIINPQALSKMLASLQMDKINANEHLLQSCNAQLLNLIVETAQKQAPVDIANVLTRYAFDAMFVMTTGQRAGFLDVSPEKAKVDAALSDWKLHSVLYGSYLRYHPFIKYVLRILRCASRGRSDIDPAMEVLGRAQISSATSGTNAEDNEDQRAPPNAQFPISATEARIALALAGADSAIALMLEVLRVVSQDRELQESLIEEMANVGLTETPSFQEIVLRKLHMPLMHGLIQQTLRLQCLSDSNMSFVAPDGGARIGCFVVKEGHTIHVASVASNFSSLDMDSPRALDPGMSPEINRHLPAYNLWNQDHVLQDCHTVLTAKLLSQVLRQFELTSEDGGSTISFAITPVKADVDTDRAWSKKRISSEDRDSGQNSKTKLSPSDMDILGENLGPDLTGELFERFDPAPDAALGNDVIKVGPITHPAARAALHQVLERIYGERIQHRTDVDSIFYIAAKRTWLQGFRGGKPGNSRYGQRQKNYRSDVHPWYKDVAETRQRRQTLQANQKWVGWALGEHQKSVDAKSAENHAIQPGTCSIDEKVDSKPTVTRFKETFKQTVTSSNDSGSRQVVRTDTTIRGADGSTTTTTSNDGIDIAQHKGTTYQPPAPRKEGWVPPHKRAEAERKRQTEEAAAAIASALLISLPSSPLFKVAAHAMSVPRIDLPVQDAVPNFESPADDSEATLQPSAATRSDSAVCSSASLWGILKPEASDFGTDTSSDR